MKYDVLLLNIHRHYFVEDNGFGDFLGIHLLAAFLSENGFETRAFAGDTVKIFQLLETEIGYYGVKTIGLYCDYENQSEVTAISAYVKEQYGVPVLVGGPQAFALEAEFFTQSKCDAVIVGEGELTILEATQCLLDGAGDISRVCGLKWLSSDGAIVTNEPQALIANLDALPFPSAKYSLNNGWRTKVACLLTGRGCPFTCSFCYEGGNTKTVRYRSVANVMAEIDELLEESPHIKYLTFADDTFTLDADRVAEFCNALVERRKKHDFVWFCEGHVKTLVNRQDLIRKMVDAGMVRLQIGVETGSPSVLALYNKQTTVEDIALFIRECTEVGVPQVVANFIVGGAGESEATVAESITFAKELLRCGAGMAEFRTTYLWPLPGTAITNNPEHYGLILLDPASLTSRADYPVVATEALDLADICNLRSDFDKTLMTTMEELLPTINQEQLIQQFRLAESYGAASLWYQFASQRPEKKRYYSLLGRGYGRRTADITEDELLCFRPLRTIELTEHHKDCLKLNNEILTPIQTRILQFSTGKVTWRELLVLLKDEFGRSIHELQFRLQMKEILQTLENRCWVLLVPI